MTRLLLALPFVLLAASVVQQTWLEVTFLMEAIQWAH